MPDSSRPPSYGDPLGGHHQGYPVPEAGGGYRGGMRGGGLTPRRVLKILQRKWQPILLVVALGAVGTLFYFMLTTRIYQATSMIEIRLRTPRIMAQSVHEDIGLIQPWEEFNTRLQKLRGSSMRQHFVAQYREMYPEATETDALLEDLFASRAEVRHMRNTNIIVLSAEHPEPELAARVANAYAMGAEFQSVSENRDLSNDAVAWLQEQAEVQRELVAEADARLVAYRAENQIDSLEAERKSAEASILSLNQLSVDLESQMVMLRDVAAMLEAAKEDPQQFTSLPEDIPGRRAISDALLRLDEVTAHRDGLLEKYTQQHPEVLLNSAAVERETERFLQSVERTQRAVAASIDLKVNQIESLRQKLEIQRTRAADLEMEIVKRNSEYNALARERDARERAYTGILRRIEEARLAADEKTFSVRVLERATTPERPIRPSARKVFALGLLLSMMAGFAVGLVTDRFDDRVMSVADIEAGLRLHVLGVVPRVPDAERKDLALASLNASALGQILDVFATIRSRLNSPQMAQTSKVILMASAAPEEGKTTCSSNFAIICARSKEKTLLVDFDLRPRQKTQIYADAVAKYKEKGTNHSLLHILADGDPGRFADLPVPGPCENLDIITSQASETHSPAVIIGGRSVRDFIDWARNHYDRIILDVASLGVSDDAFTLSGIADCVVIVCQPNRIRLRAMRHALQQFGNVGANVAGLIVNGEFQQGNFADHFLPLQQALHLPNRSTAM